MAQLTAINDTKLEMLLTVEKNLQRTLRPVNPNPAFVHRLENRLTNYPRISIERRSHLYENLVIVVFLMTALSAGWFFWRFLSRKY
jgi:hypothetical protein